LRVAAGKLLNMPDTVACIAELTVDRPPADTIALFTPEGERAWAPGWDPEFPVRQRTQGAGTVFVTKHAEDVTTWIMVDHDEGGVRYARVTPGATAGTVAVTVVEGAPTRTRVQVRYDLTALSADGARWLEGFAADFVAYIAHWEAAIAAVTRPVPG
jgi:hypothetical protein